MLGQAVVSAQADTRSENSTKLGALHRSAFGTWSDETASAFGPDCFEELIHYKWGYLDRQLRLLTGVARV